MAGEERKLINVKEAARLLGVSPFTVRAWLRQGRLAHVRLGRRVVLDPADLARFVDAGRVPARDESVKFFDEPPAVARQLGSPRDIRPTAKRWRAQ